MLSAGGSEAVIEGSWPRLREKLATVSVLGLTRGQLLALGVSLLITAGLPISGHFKNPVNTVFHGWSDHASHMSSAVLFWYRGWEIYEKRAQEICKDLNPDEGRVQSPLYGVGPEFTCNIPERQGERPLLVNFRDLVRAYPPGVLLYMAPEAFLFEKTALPFRTITLFIILQELVVAHLALALLLALLFGHREGNLAPGGWGSALFFTLAYEEIIHWTFAGFYDVLSIGLLFAATLALIRSRPTLALVATAGAMFVHFRALWYLPLLPVCAYEIWRLKDWRANPRRWAALMALAAVMLGLSAYAFHLAYPLLKQFPDWNPLMWKKLDVHSPEDWDWVLGFSALAAAMAYRRQWLLLGFCAWQAFMLMNTPQTQNWHSMFLFPLVGLGLWRAGREGVGFAFGMYVLELTLVFHTLINAGDIVVHLMRPDT